MPIINNFVTKKATATADTKFRVCFEELWFESVNIVALTNNAYYGDRVEQESPFFVNDVIFYDRPTELSQIYFKNMGAGNNCKIVASGVLMLNARKRELGIPIKGEQ